MTIAEAPVSVTIASDLRAFRLSDLCHPFMDGLASGGFQSRDFLAAISETLCAAHAAELVLIAVEDNAARPLALFAFARRRRMGATVIEAVDFHVTDYFAPAIVGDDIARDDVWAAVQSALPPADAIMFKKVPDTLHGRAHALSDAPFMKQMGAAAFTARLRDDLGRPVDPSTLPVARDARRKLRKLQSMGDVNFAVAEGDAETGAAIETLFDFRVTRFAGLKRDDILTRSEYRDFYRRLTRDGVARLFSLTVDGKPVAVICAMVHGDAVTLLIPSMTPDPEWQIASPGLVALYMLFEWASAKGYRLFDLSVGSAAYKARFNAQKVDLFEYQRALTPLGLPIVLDALLRRVVRRLPSTHPRLHALLRRTPLLPSVWLVDIHNLILLPLAI